MTFSQILPRLFKPKAGEPVPLETLAYIRAQNKNNAHSLVLKEFRKSGLTQAEICKRLNREPAVVSRWLGAPTNWTLDTLCDLLFAINGEAVEYKSFDQLGAAPRNCQTPVWMMPDLEVDLAKPPRSSTATGNKRPIFLAETQNA